MSAPYDSASVELADIIKQVADGDLSPEAAAPLISEQLAAVAPTQFLQYSKIVQVLGRVEGMFITDGPPTDELGAVGATALDLTNRYFYGPKTTEGWGAGISLFDGAADQNVFLVESYGAFADSTAVDNTAAINAAEAAAALVGGTVKFRDGVTYYFKGTLLADRDGLSWQGRNTRLIYNGASTTRNLVEWGDGETSRIDAVVSGIEIGSMTVMASPSCAIYAPLLCRSTLDIELQGQDLYETLGNNLYHGLWLDGFDNVRVNGEAFTGQGDPGRVNGAAGSGPKAELFWNVRKSFGGAIGLRIGGAAGGVYLRESTFADNDYNVVVDQSLVAETNREIFMEDAIIDVAGVDGVYINDPGNPVIQLPSKWIATSGRHGVNITAGTGQARITLPSGATIKGNAQDGVLIASALPVVNLSGGQIRENGRYGVNPSVSGHRVVIGDAQIFSNTTANYNNTYAPAGTRTFTNYAEFIDILSTRVEAAQLFVDSLFGSYLSGGNPFRAVDNNDYDNYDRTANRYGWFVAGGQILAASLAGLAIGPGNDALLTRGGAGIIDQRNGTAAQAHWITNTWTDPSNYERGVVGWNGNAFDVNTAQAGTGVSRNLRLYTTGAGELQLGVASSIQWKIATGGHWLANTDAVYNIGASGANRPNNIYAAGNGVFGGGGTFGDNLTVTKNQNALTGITVSNSTAGTTTRTGFTLNSDVGSLVADSFSSAWTPSGGGDDVANGARLYSTGAGGLSLRATHASGTLRFYTGSTERFQFTAAGNGQLAAASLFGWSDVLIARDATDVLALRRTTNAQALRIYNSFTDLSNYERGGLFWSGNTFFITTASAGTGTARAMVIQAQNGLSLSGNGSSNEQWGVLSSGHLRPNPDNTYDLGVTATRVRTGYFRTSVDIGGNTLTASAPALNIAQTWNNAAVTFTGALNSFTDTASNAASLLEDWRVGGVSQFNIAKNGLAASATGFQGPNLIANTALYLGSGLDVVAQREAADTWAQYRGTNAQTFRLYNSRTDASNYNRFSVSFSANDVVLQSQAAGTGTLGSLLLNGASVGFQSAGTTRMYIAAAGHLFMQVDNTYDIGASGANRVRNLYVGTSGVFGSSVLVQAATGTPYLAIENTGGLGGAASMYFLGGSASGQSYFGFRNGFNIGTTTSVGGSITSVLTLSPAGAMVLSSSLTATSFSVSATSSMGGASLVQMGALSFGASSDVTIQRDGAADILGLYRSTNAQTFRIYNSRTDASNYERGVVGWTSNVMIFGVENAGTGGQRSVRLSGGVSGNNYIQVNPNSSSRQIQVIVGGSIIDYYNIGGHRLWETDNTYDLGASGANRPRTGYFATSVVAPTHTIDANFYLALSGGNPLILFDLNDGISYDRGGNSMAVLVGGATKLAVGGAAVTATVPIVHAEYTVATLPTGVNNMRAFVTDASGPVFGAAVVGGGAVRVPVYFDGTWRVG